MSGFKEFLEKFNVIPIAVALVLALAFQPMIDSVVNLILSIVARVFGMEPDPDTGAYSISNWEPAGLPVGDVFNAIVTFLMIAWVVYMIVKALQRSGANTEPAATPDQKLLTEIRDLLAERN